VAAGVCACVGKAMDAKKTAPDTTGSQAGIRFDRDMENLPLVLFGYWIFVDILLPSACAEGG